jgi:RHS repeat-associated protein
LDDPSGSITSQTTRGFTGQEELADVGLVHLNGRVYDPLVGRMMSADPFVPDPMNGQAWNRYSYVINNPLALTDPNGYCFLGLCGIGKAIGKLFDNTFGALIREVGRLFRDVPILGTIFEIAAVAMCAGNPICAIPVAFASTIFVAGVTSGSLGYALRSGLVAAATAGAFYAVGGLTNVVATGSPDSFFAVHNPPAFGTPPYAFNVAGHALVGCASSAASGGKCGPGALAAGVTSAAGPAINSDRFGVGSLVANTVLGGAAAVAGGGKFANGAITGAFGYLFNGAAGRFVGGLIGGAIFGIGAIETGPSDIFALLTGHFAGGEIGSRIEDALFGTGAETTTVIGRTNDLQNLGPDERSLLDRLPDQGSPKANWDQNSSLLRQEMSLGLPIRDASPGDTGGVWLNAERNLLIDRGWTFNPQTNYWMPPPR